MNRFPIPRSLRSPLLAICAAVLPLFVPLNAMADVWKVVLQDAKREAHYLVNTQSGVVTSMRGQQCVRTFTGKVEGEKVIVESELAGGGNAGGTRGSQRLEFVLRQGVNAAQVTTNSTVRGSRPPVPANASLSCKGAACAMPSC